MLGLFTIKNGIRLCSLGIITGFCAGCAAGVYNVFMHNYLTYKFYALIGYTFRKYMNGGIGTALLVCLIVTGAVVVAHIISRYISLPEQRPAKAKLFGVIFFCLVAGSWVFGRVHQAWSTSLPLERHISLFWQYDIYIILGVLVLGWILMKMPLGKLFASSGKQCLVLALPVLVIVGLVNGGVYFFDLYAVPERPNIILISIDALRADHMGCYGYKRNTTPNIDVFARENVLFTNAFANEPWTLTSHMSMLTGLYTITHEVYNWRSLDFKIPTLTEYLKNAGYATIASVNSGWLRPGFGFGKGFDRYRMYSPNDPSSAFEWAAEEQNTHIFEALQKVKRTPFFAFIHYYDVHSNFLRLPYDAPSEFKRRFIPDSAPEFTFRVPGVYASYYLKYINRKKIQLSEEELESIVDLYDSGIAYMDHYISELFHFLREMDLYDDTLIIITADHGEEFQENGWMLHSNPYFYDVLMRVPLIVKLPQDTVLSKNTIIESLVELIDIQPSILDYLSMQPLFSQGESFVGLMRGEGSGKEYVYGFGSKNNLSIRSKTWKLMSDDGLNRNRYRLYNVKNDPDEQHNVVSEYPEIQGDLEKKLRLRVEESLELRARMVNSGRGAGVASGREVKLKEDEKERLRSLGYVL